MSAPIVKGGGAPGFAFIPDLGLINSEFHWLCFDTSLNLPVPPIPHCNVESNNSNLPGCS